MIQVEQSSGHNNTPGPYLNRADGKVITIVLPSGIHRTYLMTFTVTNSKTGELLAEEQGLTLHEWLQRASAEELAAVGAGVVEKIALWAAGVR